MNYWPDGLPRTLEYPPVTVDDLCAAAAEMFPERAAVIDGDDQLTFAELYEHSCAFANALRTEGFSQGDVVVLHLANSLWFFVAYFGTLIAGGTVSPVNPLSTAAALRSQLTDTGAVLAVSHPGHVGPLLEARAATTVRKVVLVPGTPSAPVTRPDAPTANGITTTLASFTAGQPTTRPAVTVGQEDVAHLVYTGGTTGVPKGVRVLQRNVVGNVTQMVGWRAGCAIETTPRREVTLRRFPGLKDAPVVVGEAVTAFVSPLFHAHALINANFLLLCGSTVVITGRFSAERLLELIERHGVTYITGSPTMWHALVRSADLQRRDLSSIRVLSSGAAPIDPKTLEQMQRAFPRAVITEGYGLTEGTCLVTAGPALPTATRKIGSVGLPVFDTEVEIRGEGPQAEPLGPGERGRLWVKGPQVTGDYLDQLEATRDQFIDGWLDTGDIAYIDEDGFVFICDRAKDMLIYKGYNVYPRELEEVLTAHPDIDSAAVIGRDSAAAGQEPVAFVVPRRGAQITSEAIMVYVAERVLPYKKLRDVTILDSLPTSPAGKILKTELRRASSTGSGEIA